MYLLQKSTRSYSAPKTHSAENVHHLKNLIRFVAYRTNIANDRRHVELWTPPVSTQKCQMIAHTGIRGHGLHVAEDRADHLQVGRIRSVLRPNMLGLDAEDRLILTCRGHIRSMVINERRKRQLIGRVIEPATHSDRSLRITLLQ